MNEQKISIAIDGPAAAGKSTVAKIVAEKLGYVYIDTGAMYRALTYKAIQENINIQDENKLHKLLLQTTIELKIDNGAQHVFLDGNNVTSDIRESNVTNAVSIVAAHGLIRQEMVKRQQQLSKNGGVVMDGRDIGTKVMPEAELKIFLLASVEIRAKRRYEENIKKGFQTDLEKLQKEIAQRDKLDSEREISPLKKAADAEEIDTSALQIDEVVNEILNLAVERIEAN